MTKQKGTLGTKFQQARCLAFGLYPMMREASAAIAKLTDCIEELRGESPCVPTDRMQVWQRRLSHDFGMSMECLDNLQKEFDRFAGENLKKTMRPIPERTEEPRLTLEDVVKEHDGRLQELEKMLLCVADTFVNFPPLSEPARRQFGEMLPYLECVAQKGKDDEQAQGERDTQG